MAITRSVSASKFQLGNPRHPNAVPRDEPAEEVEMVNGRPWKRNWPMPCSICGRIMYGYAPEDLPAGWPYPPGMADSSRLTFAGGHRITCGRSECVQASQDEHFAWCQEERARIKERKLMDAAAQRADEAEARSRWGD